MRFQVTLLDVSVFNVHTKAWNIIFCGQPSFVVQQEGELVVRLHMVNILDLQLYHITASCSVKWKATEI